MTTEPSMDEQKTALIVAALAAVVREGTDLAVLGRAVGENLDIKIGQDGPELLLKAETEVGAFLIAAGADVNAYLAMALAANPHVVRDDLKGSSAVAGAA